MSEGPVEGDRLGPYVLGPRLGAGGMGVVFRARDERLQRAVALKLLPRALETPERLRRFETEARAAAAISHPNVIAIFDVEIAGAHPYLVTELLEGESLAELLRRGAPPLDRTIALARGLAAGLAALHERGIVHRDVKPSNLFVLKDGTLKLLDLGLAKITSTSELRKEGTLTDDRDVTHEGAVLGTVGYMAPEQVSGRPTDARADVFGFGCVLQELLTGARAFDGPTPVEISYRILREDPAPLPASVPPAIARVVARCLAKDPAARYQSMRDVGFALEDLDLPRPRTATERPARARSWPIAFVGGAVLGALLFFVARRIERPAPAPATEAVYTQITRRPGFIASARFAPSGAGIVYSERESEVEQVWLATPGNLEARPLTARGVRLFDLSPSGELALGEERPNGHFTLQRAPFGGGAPRAIDEEILSASFAPNGEMLVVRAVGDRKRIEYPIGHTICESQAWFVEVRLSPHGDLILLTEWIVPSYSIGHIDVLGLDGSRRRLVEDRPGLTSPRWSPDQREIWYGEGALNFAGRLRAISLDGPTRTIASVPADARIQAIGADGRVLVSTEVFRHRIAGRLAGDEREHDLSWLELSDSPELSNDGRALLSTVVTTHDEHQQNVTYLRANTGEPAVALGPGNALALSPDGRWALSGRGSAYSDLVAVPTGPGAPKNISKGTLELVTRAFWMPSGDALVLVGRERGRSPRLWLVGLDGGEPRAISAEGVISACPPSRDGRWIPAFGADRRAFLLGLDGDRRELAGLPADVVPIQWTEDQQGLFVRTLGHANRVDGYLTTAPPVVIERFELATGRRTPWKVIVPPEPGGTWHVDVVSVTPDGSAYAYAYMVRSSTLYLVEGLR